jgi:pimeloyl-[acyl-carrier protein] methyl ester esterase
MKPDSRNEPPRGVLVLLHGFALHSGIWGDWLAELAPLVEPRAIDLPGHGGSSWDARIGDLAGLARAVSGEIPPGAVVLGWSLGGMVALELARQRIADIRGLVLIATTPRFVAGADWPHGVEPRVLEAFAHGVRNDYERTVQDFLALQVLGATDPRTTLRALRDRVRSRPAPDPSALDVGLDILRRADLRPALEGIRLDALVITGQRDRLVHPRAGAILAAALPRARVRRIEGSGHAPFLSHPAVVRDELATFLERVRPEAVRRPRVAG